MFFLLAWSVHARARSFCHSFFSMNCTFQWKLSLFHNRFYFGFLCATKTIGHHTLTLLTTINLFLSVYMCVCAMHAAAIKKIQAILCLLLFLSLSLYPHKLDKQFAMGFQFVSLYLRFLHWLLMHWTKKETQITKPLIEFNVRAVTAAENLNCRSIYFLSFNWNDHQKSDNKDNISSSTLKSKMFTLKVLKKGETQHTRENANSLIKKAEKAIKW